MAENKKRKFIPALRFDWLTPLYDPMMRFIMRESSFKTQLIKQAKISSHQKILDLGCGTATLSILIKQAYPNCEVMGLDPDPKILDIARAKIVEAGLDIKLDEGFSSSLPYPDSYFDRVFSSMVFHHLTTEVKLRTALEILRVLRPGGEFHIADFGKPHNPVMFASSIIMRHLEENYGNVQGIIPHILVEASFKPVIETAKYSTIFGTLRVYKSSKPTK